MGGLEALLNSLVRPHRVNTVNQVGNDLLQLGTLMNQFDHPGNPLRQKPLLGQHELRHLSVYFNHFTISSGQHALRFVDCCLM
ncbi:hypothetical protein HanIR_Chr03g0128531 [Helianthus annuus]|nr:hypothetical protein HanIR_Chr03g0128531 [Helianthus annuus]